MSRNAHIHAQLESNVQITILEQNRLKQVKRFKNTSTRLLTQSICDFLSGSDVSYIRGAGRPNFMSLGTMGIKQQGNLGTPVFESQFSDPNPPAQDRTRPWFESTSLALTDTCGTAVVDDEGRNPHFWNPRYGWGTPDNPDVPCFEGELCTAMDSTSMAEWLEKGWEPITRLPILRADVVVDKPEDRDFGIDGHSSAVVFYTYVTPAWINRLLEPKQLDLDSDVIGTTEPVGPQLDRIAISEFGLYEKNNTELGGLDTMLAGFRVPSESDVVYLERNQVMIIEWRITVRAVLPYEGVGDKLPPEPEGISITGDIVADLQVQFHSAVRGADGVNQEVTWSLAHQSNPDTTLSNDGLLIVDPEDRTDVLYVTATSAVNPEIYTTAVVYTGYIKNQVLGVDLTVGELTIDEETGITLEHSATTRGEGIFSNDVTWTLLGNTSQSTTLSSEGLLTIGPDENSEYLQVVATADDDSRIATSNTLMLGPTVVQLQTTPITQVSALSQDIGDVIIESDVAEIECNLMLTIRLVGQSTGTCRLLINQFTDTSESVIAKEYAVTEATDNFITIYQELTIGPEPTEILISASGPVTMPEIVSYIYGSKFHEVVQENE